MKLNLQKIKRNIQFKAVLYGFLAYFVIGWTIASIVGGGYNQHLLAGLPP